MRADRLLSILLLLQARGRMTAGQLAAEVEVSERTIYRDIDALSAAGVPVYADRGAGGGYELLDRFRTTLTGLTADEARALFMLSVPAPLARLGVDGELRSALRKLSAELPEARREDAEGVRRRFFIDPEWWRERDDAVPHMEVIHRAVWANHRLRIVRRPPFCEAIEQLVDPYGLVAKAGIWHLVVEARGRMRVNRVSELIDVRDTGEEFARRPGFDLPAFWQDWCRGQQALLARFTARVRVAPSSVDELRRRLGASVRGCLQEPGVSADPGGLDLELSFESFDEARAQLLAFGRGVEVIAPEPLRWSVLDYAEQVVDLYSGRAVAS